MKGQGHRNGNGNGNGRKTAGETGRGEERALFAALDEAVDHAVAWEQGRELRSARVEAALRNVVAEWTRAIDVSGGVTAGDFVLVTPGVVAAITHARAVLR